MLSCLGSSLWSSQLSLPECWYCRQAGTSAYGLYDFEEGGHICVFVGKMAMVLFVNWGGVWQWKKISLNAFVCELSYLQTEVFMKWVITVNSSYLKYIYIYVVSFWFLWIKIWEEKKKKLKFEGGKISFGSQFWKFQCMISLLHWSYAPEKKGRNITEKEYYKGKLLILWYLESRETKPKSERCGMIHCSLESQTLWSALFN